VITIGLKSRRERGAAAVEFALVLIPLVIILFGAIEFGVLLYDRQVVTNASREGARAGIVAGEDRVTAGEISTIVFNYCANNLITFGDSPNLQVVVEPNPTSGASFGDELTVTVTYNYDFLFIPNFTSIGRNFTLTAKTVMRYE
jgi:Flp pilus assembly protein TadG